jgi:hypothetical protein
MKIGALLAGNKSQVEQTFSITLDEVKTAGTLPVPAEMRDHIDSVTLFRPRSYVG